MAKQAGKGVEEFRPYVTRSIPVGANIVCADNSGAKILEVINVPRHKTRASVSYTHLTLPTKRIV